METISACGLVCSDCEFFNKTCTGCYGVKGSTFWAKEMMPDKVCPLFKCALFDHGYESCGDCDELPCALFLSMKDPSISDEEHQKMIKVRVERLRT
jgi:hypothetical protein